MSIHDLTPIHGIPIRHETHAKLSYLSRRLGRNRAELCRDALEAGIAQLERELGLHDDQGRLVPDYQGYLHFHWRAAEV